MIDESGASIINNPYVWQESSQESGILHLQCKVKDKVRQVWPEILVNPCQIEFNLSSQVVTGNSSDKYPVKQCFRVGYDLYTRDGEVVEPDPTYYFEVPKSHLFLQGGTRLPNPDETIIFPMFPESYASDKPLVLGTINYQTLDLATSSGEVLARLIDKYLNTKRSGGSRFDSQDILRAIVFSPTGEWEIHEELLG